MIDLARHIVNKESSSLNQNITVNSVSISTADVTVKDDKVSVMLNIEKEYSGEFNDEEFPKPLVDIYGRDEEYRFCFVLLSAVTDMDKSEKSEFIKSNVMVGQSIRSNYIEAHIQIPEDQISDTVDRKPLKD